MRLVVLAFLCLIFSLSSQGQVIITGNDMPEPGDTVRRSMTLDIQGIDYEATGEFFYWDFSGLSAMIQQVDTFVEVSATPLLYQAVFNNQFIFPDYKATVAKKLTEFNLIPGLDVSDAYQFYRLAGDEFREVGVGVTLMEVPLPVSYQDIDTLYRFPLEYGNMDSSNALLSINVPGLGYLEVDRKRKNTADGWGTLLTPYGEFQALRVKTEIEEYDSVYIDSLNTGFPVDRQYVEYKWMTNGIPQPLLTITVEGPSVTASYVDSVRNAFQGLGQGQIPGFDFNFFPNPASGHVTVNYELNEPAMVSLSLYTLEGKEVTRITSDREVMGQHNKVINLDALNLKPGLYLVRFQVDDMIRVKRITIQ
jgi:hypothetical protein